MSDEVVNQLSEQHTEQVQEQHQQEQESAKDLNFRLVRERAEAAERRLAQLEYERQQERQQKQYERQEPQEQFDIDEDGYVDGRQLKKFMSAQEKKAEKELAKLKNEISVSALKIHFKDFDDVVNEENLQRVAKEDPNLYESIAYNPDVYKRGAALYDLVKKYKSNAINNQYAPKKVEQTPVPRSAAGIGSAPSQSPLIQFAQGDRRILSEEEKARVRQRVEDLKSRSY